MIGHSSPRGVTRPAGLFPFAVGRRPAGDRAEPLDQPRVRGIEIPHAERPGVLRVQGHITRLEGRSLERARRAGQQPRRTRLRSVLDNQYPFFTMIAPSSIIVPPLFARAWPWPLRGQIAKGAVRAPRDDSSSSRQLVQLLHMRPSRRRKSSLSVLSPRTWAIILAHSCSRSWSFRRLFEGRQPRLQGHPPTNRAGRRSASGTTSGPLRSRPDHQFDPYFVVQWSPFLLYLTLTVTRSLAQQVA